MGQTLLAAVTSGFALAGVLAVAGTGAGRLSRRMPHIGVGAVGAAAAVIAARLTTAPAPVRLLAVVAAGAVAGCLACLLERRVREVDAPVWPPALLAEVAVLGLALGIAGLARPATALDLPLGPLGGLSTMMGSTIAGIAGITFALIATAAGIVRREMLLWAVVAGGTAAALAFGAGAVALQSEAIVATFGIPDVAGLALRAAAVGVFARRGLWPGILAALVLGVAESVARSQFSTGEAALLPAVAVLAWGVWQAGRRAPVTAAA